MNTDELNAKTAEFLAKGGAVTALDWAGKPVPEPERQLTEEAQSERRQFESETGGCYCHTGAAPCGHCTHPGNPLNQEEDDSAWQPVEQHPPAHANLPCVVVIVETTAEPSSVISELRSIRAAAEELHRRLDAISPRNPA